MTGALLVDKPSGPTSHDVVAFARRLLKTSRIGHTGTLDPLATGLLVLLVGPATRLAQFLSGDDKEYLADVRLGISTPTYDAQSLETSGGSRLQAEDPVTVTPTVLNAALSRFRGSFLQTPPPYSAKKIGGVRAYESARRNEPVHLQPVPVTVRELEVVPAPDTGHRDPTLLRVRVTATAGFYVRSLAHDLGQALGCGAHLEALRRTRAGRFRVEDAATLDALEAAGPAAVDRIVPVNALLGDFPAVTLTADGLRRAANGNPLAPAHLEGVRPGSDPFVRVLDAAGGVLAVAERRPDGLLHPVVVLR